MKHPGRSQRQKGHSFEREIARRFKEIFPDARRQLEYHADDAKGVDLAHTGRYRIQCKRRRAYSPLSALKEVEAREWLGEVPVLITQADRQPILAVLPFDELLRLIKKAHS